MPAYQPDRPAIKGRVIARFPAQVYGSNGLAVTKANGAFTIGNDWGSLNTATAISEPARTWLAVYLSPSGSSSEEYSRIAWDAFVSEMIRGQEGGFSYIIDGGGSVIATGIKGDIPVPFDCEIIEAGLLARQSGDLVVDVWRDAYANFPPTDADSITASAPVTLAGAAKSRDTTLTGWSKTLTTGEILRFNVDSCNTIEQATLYLKVRRT